MTLLVRLTSLGLIDRFSGRLFQQLQQASWSQRLLLISCSLFPLLTVAVQSGGSAIYIMLLLPALVYGWSVWPDTTVQQRYWMLSGVALFILAAMSLLYSSDVDTGVKKLDRLFRLTSIGLIYLYLRRMRVDAGRLFLLGVGAGAIILGVQALYEIYELKLKYSSGIYHKIVFGDMAVLNAAILLAAVLTVAKRTWHYALAFVCIAMALYASLMSYTRAAWLLVPVLICVVLYLYRGAISRRVWLAFMTVMLLGVMLLSVIQPERLKQGVVQGMHDLELFLDHPDMSSSWGDRLNMWRNSLIIWSRDPLLGTGLGDFNHDSRQLVEDGVSYSRHIVKYGHAHSIYFDVLATLGVTGLILLTVFLVVIPWMIFYRYWKNATDSREKFYALSGLLSVFCFAFFGLTEGWTSRNPFVNAYVIYIAVFAAGLAVRETDRVKMNVSAGGQ